MCERFFARIADEVARGHWRPQLLVVHLSDPGARALEMMDASHELRFCPAELYFMS